MVRNANGRAGRRGAAHLQRDNAAEHERAARGLGDAIAARGVMRRIAPPQLGWVPFAEPIYDTFAFTWRRDAQLSPATREFVTFAERRLDELAGELRTDPPRRRMPGVSRKTASMKG